MPWAIDTRSKSGHGFIGVFWWSPFLLVPEECDGLHVALFRTREIARKRLAAVKRAFPDSRVVHVNVSVMTLQR